MEERIYKGDLVLNETGIFPYTKVTGSLCIYSSAKLEAPALTSVGADLSIQPSAKLAALTSVGGHLYIQPSAKLEAPALTSVGGHLSIQPSAKLEAPALTSVGGTLSIQPSASLAALTSVGVSLYIYSSAKLEAPALTSVGADLYIQPSAKLEAPALTSVGGTLYIQPSAKLEAPKVIYNDKNALALCRKSLNDSFAKNGFVLADGILAKLISRRGPVSRVIICGKNEISYLVTDGENYAHGKTLKEARESLIYKITSRDTSEFKVWRLDEIVTKRDAIRAYRAITGACEAGVRTWMEQRKTPESISIKDIIKLTEGSYGAREFKEFFENK